MKPNSVVNGLAYAAVDPFAQVFTRLEMRHVFPGQGHRLAGLRITPLAWRAEMQREAAETADLDALASRERIAHDFQNLLKRQLHILGWQMFLSGRDDFDQFRFGHARAL